MTSSVTQSGSFAFATPIVGFLIPVPSGWKFTDKGNECYLEKANGEAVRFKLKSVLLYGSSIPVDVLDRYCTKWEVFEWKENGIDTKRRHGYRRRTDGVLEWLVNQK